MKKAVSLMICGILLTISFSLVHASPAFADLKAAVNAICDAYTNGIVATFGPAISGFGGTGSGVGMDCGDFMVFMDQNKWHVIHDMRTGGAWFDIFGTGGPCPSGHACFELIFLKD